MFTYDVGQKRLNIESKDATKVGSYTIWYKASLANPLIVTSGYSDPFTVDIIDGCSTAGGLQILTTTSPSDLTTTIPSNPPTYFYTGVPILVQLSNVFSTNKDACPINAYDCKTSTEPTTNCESILTGADAAVIMDRSSLGGNFTFMAGYNSIPANLPGTYPIKFSATAGTIDDVSAEFTYTVTLRCMIEPS